MKYVTHTLFPLLFLLLCSCNSNQVNNSSIPQYLGDPVTVTIAAVQGIHASSSLKEKNNFYRYHPVKALDRYQASSWVEGAEGSGTGQNISIFFAQPVTADMIKIMNGYFDPRWFAANNRVKSLGVYLDDFITTVPLADGMTEKEIPLGQPRTFGRAVFTIEDVYKGQQFDDTCIAEIRFFRNGKEIMIKLDEANEIIKNLPPGPNLPGGKKIIYYGMEGRTTQYFFPDGMFIEIRSSIEQPEISSFEIRKYSNKTYGNWKFNKETGEIEIQVTLNCFVKGVGKNIYSRTEFREVFEDYQYIEEKTEKKYQFQWQEIGNEPVFPPDSQFITSGEYKLKDRLKPEEIRVEIERLKALYHETLTNPPDGK
jgi:hypothetical protein